MVLLEAVHPSTGGEHLFQTTTVSRIPGCCIPQLGFHLSKLSNWILCCIVDSPLATGNADEARPPFRPVQVPYFSTSNVETTPVPSCALDWYWCELHSRRKAVRRRLPHVVDAICTIHITPTSRTTAIYKHSCLERCTYGRRMRTLRLPPFRRLYFTTAAFNLETFAICWLVFVYTCRAVCFQVSFLNCAPTMRAQGRRRVRATLRAEPLANENQAFSG